MACSTICLSAHAANDFMVPYVPGPQYNQTDVALLPKANAIYMQLRSFEIFDPATLGDIPRERDRYRRLEALRDLAQKQLVGNAKESYFYPCADAAQYLFLAWGYSSDMNLSERKPTTKEIADVVTHAQDYGRSYADCEARVFEVSDAVDAHNAKAKPSAH